MKISCMAYNTKNSPHKIHVQHKPTVGANFKDKKERSSTTHTGLRRPLWLL